MPSTDRAARRNRLVTVTLAVSLLQAFPSAQAEFGVTEIADYRLDAAVFTQFNRASHLIAAAARADARFDREPVFTKDILLSGDVLPMAVALEARLRNDPALAGAFVAADITPHDYTKFALALVAARLAHGFVKSGVIRRVPPGIHADNVMFVDANLAEVQAVLKETGVE
ncbi:MAG TPA: hypothetical protein VGQ37_14070 [Vicinamibacterales bacterium]|jgi:hypothetical protein|nr:hypothetical protein [Vicinamibacterales bacterium]